MRLLAVGDKFVAKKLPQDSQTRAGLLLPQLHLQRFKEALVIDIDPGFKTRVKKGDHIRYWQTVFEYEDGIMVLREDHVACIIEEDEIGQENIGGDVRAL